MVKRKLPLLASPAGCARVPASGRQIRARRSPRPLTLLCIGWLLPWHTSYRLRRRLAEMDATAFRLERKRPTPVPLQHLQPDQSSSCAAAAGTEPGCRATSHVSSPKCSWTELDG